MKPEYGTPEFDKMANPPLLSRKDFLSWLFVIGCIVSSALVVGGFAMIPYGIIVEMFNLCFAGFIIVVGGAAVAFGTSDVYYRIIANNARKRQNTREMLVAAQPKFTNSDQIEAEFKKIRKEMDLLSVQQGYSGTLNYFRDAAGRLR